MWNFSRQTYYDKVYACWLGKNAGGTLGTPLERIYGQEEMFDVWWYPKLVPGGMPNDDLEIQLVWLQALQERGLDITAKDLADYWLKCITYNPDEYGLHKTNLRKGLLPPVSGWFNNWFKDCMGSPIRSEIWACISPGMPHTAANYAYQDAICDHAGGESVFGEIFNACIESAAFFINDRKELIKFGLKTIPESSKTSIAINTAFQCFLDGVDWKTARNIVLEKVFSPIAQYSPVNLGFQTIGLLYGNDFGDAICKAVNCGYDTDCTGATVGAIWGIMHGMEGLPKKWIEPLGESVVISPAIKNLTAPTNLKDLTKITCGIGEKVLKKFQAPILLTDSEDSDKHKEDSHEISKYLYENIILIKPILARRPNIVEFQSPNKLIDVELDYIQGPAINPEIPLPFAFYIKNNQEYSIDAELSLNLPKDCFFEPLIPRKIQLKPHDKFIYNGKLTYPARDLGPSIKLLLKISLIPANEQFIIPLNFTGSTKWLKSEVIPIEPNVKDPLKKKYSLEKDKNIRQTDENWKIVWKNENNLEIEPYFGGKSGILYLKHFLLCPESRKVRIGVPTNQFMKLWVNGKKVHQTRKQTPLRPNYSGDGSNYTNISLKKGWNSIMIKFYRDESPIEAHFTICMANGHHGITDINQSKST